MGKRRRGAGRSKLSGFKRGKNLLCESVPSLTSGGGTGPGERWEALLGLAMNEALESVTTSLAAESGEAFASASTLGPKAAAEAALNASGVGDEVLLAGLKAAADSAFARLTGQRKLEAFERAVAAGAKAGGGRRARRVPKTQLGKLSAVQRELRDVMARLETEMDAFADVEAELAAEEATGGSRLPGWVAGGGEATPVPPFVDDETRAMLEESCPLVMGALLARERGEEPGKGVEDSSRKLQASLDITFGAMADRMKGGLAFQRAAEAYLTQTGRIVHAVSFQGLESRALEKATVANSEPESANQNANQKGGGKKGGGGRKKGGGKGRRKGGKKK